MDGILDLANIHNMSPQELEHLMRRLKQWPTEEQAKHMPTHQSLNYLFLVYGVNMTVENVLRATLEECEVSSKADKNRMAPQITRLQKLVIADRAGEPVVFPDSGLW